MPQEIYEIVAGAARYWFLFLMVLIVFRSFRWYRKDQKQHKKQLKLMPDAGYIGEMVVVHAQGDELAHGETLPVSWEGVLGCTRINDLYIPAPGVAARHCLLRFEEKRGLLVVPFRGRTVQVDGENCTHKEPAYMFHGSFLVIGETVLRLRMFSGFETRLPMSAVMPMSAPAEKPRDEEPLFAQNAPYPASVPSPEQMAAWHQMVQQQLIQQQMMQQMAWMQWAQWQQSVRSGAAAKDEPEENGQPEGKPKQTIYPPVLDEKTAEESSEEAGSADCPQEDPYAAYRRPVQPRSRYDDDYYDDLLDEDMTDAARSSRSIYVGEDEARVMKREIWDRILGGDRK